MERVFADIDADYGDRGMSCFGHGVLLVFGAPLPASIAGGAGARPDHSISGHPLATKRREITPFLGGAADYGGVVDVAASAPRSRQLVKEEIDGGDLAVPGDDEIGSGVSRRFARAARDPRDPPAIAQLLRRADRLILKVRMSSLDHTCDAVDLVAATVGAAGGVIEHAIFVVDLVDGRATTRGVDFAEDVAEI